MRNKYFYQIFGSHLIIVLTAFLILSLLFTTFVRNFVYENKVDELTSYGDQLMKVALSDSPLSKRSQLYSFRNMLEAQKVQLYLFDETGQILPSNNKNPFPNFYLSEEEWERLKNGERVSVLRDFGRFDEGVTFVALPIIEEQEMLGGMILMSPISGITKMIDQINRYLLIVIIISLVTALIISYVLSRIFEKRVQKLRDATSMIASGDYNVHVEDNKRDEIGQLAQDFNDMAGQLKRSQEDIERLEKRRRQFIADVSHELRTPLTTIRGLIEGIKNNLIPPEQKEKSMKLIEQETIRLIRLVNENLDYEKIRSNQVVLQREEIYVVDVFEIIKDQLSLLAEEKQNEIHLEAPEDLTVFADYDRIIQIILNITKNSIQFTSKGTITLRGRKGYKETIIEIEDTGIGMDKEEIESIWLRFYKADISRKSTSYGEFGLGLSIVKQLVLLHNGTIEVESKKQKGTKFIISIPDEKKVVSN